jgi:di- and tripeptidase
LPSQATASISIRIVPNQSIDAIGESLIKHLQNAYKAIGGKDELLVDIRRGADWWLGDRTSIYNKALFEAIHKEWSIEPL